MSDIINDKLNGLSLDDIWKIKFRNIKIWQVGHLLFYINKCKYVLHNIQKTIFLINSFNCDYKKNNSIQSNMYM